jgi:glycosyltransferase involved in cell wall biosynthesis
VPKVSVTIITLNESDHIEAAIDSASWADEILVVDAGSRDDTVAIARRKGVRVETRAWTGYVDQKNYAQSLASHDWIFSLDADERIPPALAAEVRTLLATEPSQRGYRVPRVTHHLGRWVRTTDFYPDYQMRVYDRRAARWTGRYVHESVTIDGPPGRLINELHHYSYRDLHDQLNRLNHYSTLAARQLYEQGRRTGPLELLLHPPAAFLRNYVLRRGFMDGTVGLTISLINSYGVFLKFAKLWELQRNAQLPNSNFQRTSNSQPPSDSQSPSNPHNARPSGTDAEEGA